jgi:hypothetical protein
MTLRQFEAIPIKSPVTLTDGRKGIYVCSWFGKGKGGLKVMVELLGGKVALVGVAKIRSAP